MIHIPLWKRALVFVVVALSFAYCAPNLLKSEDIARLQQSMPSWMPTRAISLGLDLQGGSHLLMQADMASVIKQQGEDTVSALRSELRKNNIDSVSLVPQANGFKIELKNADQRADALKMIRSIDDLVTVAGVGVMIDGVYEDKALKTITKRTMDRLIEIVSRRVNESGTKEPVIQKQGEDRILVQLPGVNDPKYIINLMGKTAKLTFHLVSENPDGLGVKKLPMKEDPAQMIPLQRTALLDGDNLVDAQPSFENGAPVVSFKLDADGSRRFCKVTSDNIGKPFAVVLDKEIITAPRINSSICAGSAIISGSFTVQESSDLAVMLRAGALPTSLSVVEERSVGPSLGQDSVDAGKTASLVAFVLIIAFIVLSYGLFGVFASVALFINMVMIMALLGMMQATLTLPGIAGIILTMGMAVDANVLIFERIREEVRNGRSIIAAMDAGYEKAMASIIDSNLTSLIAGVILFAIGTGPIKGFAVTMSIGIVTSLFSAIMLTRLMLIVWLQVKKPKTLPV